MGGRSATSSPVRDAQEQAPGRVRAGASLARHPGMRAILLAVVVLGSGCTSETLSEDTAYRRLVDGFDSEAQCLAGGALAPCYQTLTLCASGRVTMDLVNRPQDGEYKLADSSIAVATFIDMRVEFDLDTQKSTQLPGRHPWEQTNPVVYDCE